MTNYFLDYINALLTKCYELEAERRYKKARSVVRKFLGPPRDYTTIAKSCKLVDELEEEKK